ncbi:4-hydroxy-3-methylbut-2-enyl diphosphate reductase [Saccharicrinis carchari]|uniref:4-hydroxy-3-methylbut-2-enyl diphosphate reductase n=1 Tax=Saccharicrinis carchari TaxID=1168039 RepID=A0A521DBH6_SACCC|nr:4-hydroxy-3-methylbut-2-enyl diphosphate reductase [Saccharicrinis carchari]SMO68975.1 4-hydroxy-3-methylbut-2-enyl diphosphate reductase [Saccharicrinis carchari]
MSSVLIEIDPASGFCFGVVKAVEKAEAHLKPGSQQTGGDRKENEKLYSLGDIVHNDMEVNRLSDKGLDSISNDDLSSLDNKKILIRAHGEPPSTYQKAKEKGHTLIDATCPVVLKLQQRIKNSWLSLKDKNGQLVIYGRHGHAEVVGLTGQTNNEAIVVESMEEAKKIDLGRPIHFYAQTTKGIEEFDRIAAFFKENIQPGVECKAFDTICRQVAGRLPKIMRFAKSHDVMVFVAGQKSSNAKMLFAKCQAANPRSYMVSNATELMKDWFKEPLGSVGVSGATSTPPWLMEQVAQQIGLITKDK